MSKISVTKSGHYFVRVLMNIFKTIFVVCIAVVLSIALLIKYLPEIYADRIYLNFLLICFVTCFVTGPLFIVLWFPLRQEKNTLRKNISKFTEEILSASLNIKTSSPKIIDSIDLELLNIINQCQGDLIEIEKQINIIPIFQSDEDFFTRITKLNVLNYIHLDLNTLRVKLTYLSIDALNTPPIFFRSSIPENISKPLFEQKISLINEKYTESVLKCAMICEIILKEYVKKEIQLDEAKKTILITKIENINIDRSTLGELIGFARIIKLFKRNSLEDVSFSHINKIRNKIHSSNTLTQEFITPEDGYICDMLLELIIRQRF